MTLRARFAPAPSGSLHVGNARTALYAWLHARHHDGVFVLRIEDTDADRVTEAGMAAVFSSLDFLGLAADEGPRVGGPLGPYVQSRRRGLHDAVARRLLAAGHAYEAFETPEELAAQADEARAAGRPPGYGGAHRDLSAQQREALRSEGRSPVLRLRTPDEGTATFDDAVRGRITVDWATVPDFVVTRADGSPTYYLANTVDDLAMAITDVIRGEDLMSAVPRQVLLGQRLLDDGLLDDALADAGLPARPDGAGPVATWAHLPLLVGEDRKPLSKRHGSVAVDEFRRQGILPEALVNLLALCGWSAPAAEGGGQRERFDLPELVRAFDLGRVGRNPAAFDVDKLRAMNGDRIKGLSARDLALRLEPVLVDAGVLPLEPTAAQRDLLVRLAPLLGERIQTLAEAVGLVSFAFRPDPPPRDPKAAAKWLKGTAAQVLALAAARLADVDRWEAGALLDVLDGIAAELGIGRGKAMQPVRVAVTGTSVSPPLPETLAELDREVVVGRVRAVADELAADEGT